MAKRIFLYVSGDGDDFSAMEFKQKYNVQDFYEDMVKNNYKEITIEDEEVEFYATVEILEFGEIDDRFIDFVRDEIHDYDRAKDYDFFEVEHKEMEEKIYDKRSNI